MRQQLDLLLELPEGDAVSLLASSSSTSSSDGKLMIVLLLSLTTSMFQC
eukprot:CAMPEP_0203731174 /NCGR_PEP_ID=MMETSP0092-20131115/21685_1 /ASSEMBLY_ACC=CAM_ASM_001090 /TAXON_ID=426623 /ORGANISM="Chaetoceros affinis, Strain CCMP159" /LENGTH=48 /DNA_ID= /DNA_START= /DNA_END= /DNA_ORIENTATION=